MKIRKTELASLFLMGMNIFLALPLILFDIFKKKNVVFVTAIFFAVIAYHFIPSDEGYDIYRYYQTFVDAEYRHAFFLTQKDIYAKYLVEILLFLKLPSNFLPFTSAFISTLLLTKSFINSSTMKLRSGLVNCVLFVVFIVNLPIIGYTGIRFIVANACFVYGVLSKNKKNNYLFPILSALTHSSCLVPLLLWFLTLVIIKRRVPFSSLIVLIAIGSAIMITPMRLVRIIQFINQFGIVKINPGYILGKWGLGYMTTRETFLSKAINYIIIWTRLFIQIFYVTFIYRKIERKTKKVNFLFLFCCFNIFLFRYFIFFERYSAIAIYLIYFSSLDKFLRAKNKLYNILLLLVFAYGFVNVIYDIKRYWFSWVLSYSNVFKLSIGKILFDIMSYLR